MQGDEVDFGTIFGSDYSEDAIEKKLNDHTVRLTAKDNLILMSFRLPVVVIRKEDGSFKLEDSTSILYPTIFKLKNKG
mgnify:CR=1 FL=1|jgi:hypothetical protein